MDHRHGRAGAGVVGEDRELGDAGALGLAVEGELRHREGRIVVAGGQGERRDAQDAAHLVDGQGAHADLDHQVGLAPAGREPMAAVQDSLAQGAGGVGRPFAGEVDGVEEDQAALGRLKMEIGRRPFGRVRHQQLLGGRAAGPGLHRCGAGGETAQGQGQGEAQGGAHALTGTERSHRSTRGRSPPGCAWGLKPDRPPAATGALHNLGVLPLLRSAPAPCRASCGRRKLRWSNRGKDHAVHAAGLRHSPPA